MRRSVAVLLLALVTFLHATDGVLCQDGCTDRAHAPQAASTPEHQQSSNDACLLCLSSLLAGPQVMQPSPAPVPREPVPPPVIRLIPAPDRDIDHPPRLS